MKNLVWGKMKRLPPRRWAQGPAMKSHKYSKTNSFGLAHAPNICHNQEPLGGIRLPLTLVTVRKKSLLVLFLASGFAIWNMFR